MSDQNISNKINALINSLNEISADAEKTEKGNKTAGTRVRKALQEVINSSKEIRKDVLNLRNTDA